MKLLHCLACHDVFGLLVDRRRECRCHRSAGVYVDLMNAEYCGPAEVLALSTPDLLATQAGHAYTWSVIPTTSSAITKIASKEAFECHPPPSRRTGRGAAGPSTLAPDRVRPVQSARPDARRSAGAFALKGSGLRTNLARILNFLRPRATARDVI